MSLGAKRWEDGELKTCCRAWGPSEGSGFIPGAMGRKALRVVLESDVISSVFL